MSEAAANHDNSADESTPSSGHSPSSSFSPEADILYPQPRLERSEVFPVPPPLPETPTHQQEQTRWPEVAIERENLAESSHASQKLAAEKEGQPALDLQIPSSAGLLPDWELGRGDDLEEPTVVWGPANFEYHERGWCVKLTWDYASCNQSREAYSLYWRRNLEPWVLHKEGVQGSSEEVQLAETEAIASYWFILRAEKLQDDLAITSPVLGPLIPPSAPGGVRQVIATEIAPGTIEVSWRPPLASCGGESVTDYEVLLENERQQQALTVCRDTRVQITDVDPDHCYTVQVCAVHNLLGRSPYCMASWPINIRHATLTALPIDGCPTESWNDEHKAPIPAEWRSWWPLDFLACLTAFLATVAFDMELAASTYSRVEDPFCMSLLLSIYLICGALATLAVDAVEAFVPPFLTVCLAKIAFIVAASFYHLYVHADSGQPAMDFRGWGIERSAMQWCMKAAAEFPELSALDLSHQMFFLLCMRGSAGGCAAAVKHITLHVILPGWLVRQRGYVGFTASMLLSKCSPLGFAFIAALSHAGFDRADAPYLLVRGLVIIVAFSALVGFILGPHSQRPSAALSLNQVSIRVMLRRLKSLCEAEVRRAIHIHTLESGVKCSFRAEVRHALQNWDGPNCPLWIWSGPCILLIDDQSPLLGLREKPYVMPTLVALLKRQIDGAEAEILESLNCMRSHALKQHVEQFSDEGQRIILDVLMLSAALDEPRDDRQRRKGYLSESTEQDSKEIYSVADLYEALERISKVSHVAVPCEQLAVTYIVTRTSQRPWLSCLGCQHCCKASILQHRLAIDRAKHILQNQAAESLLKEDASPPSSPFGAKPCTWHGACPQWADVAVCGEQRLLQSLDRKYEKLIPILFCMTSGVPYKLNDASASERGKDSEREKELQKSIEHYGHIAAEHRVEVHGRRSLTFKDFIKKYEEGHMSNKFLPAKESIELSTSDVNVAADFCSEAMLVALLKKGRHVSIDAPPKSQSDGNEALAFALSCLVLGKDTSALCKNLDIGLSQCTKDIVLNLLPRKSSGKNKEKMKTLSKRVQRILEALLRLRFFGTHCWTARTAHDVYILVFEWCALWAGGLEHFEDHDFLLITDCVHSGNLAVAARAHLLRPLEAVMALCHCDSHAVHDLLTALMAEIPEIGKALTKGVLSLVEWLEAERADLQNRLTGVDSMHVSERGCADEDPMAIDAQMLSAALALGFPSLAELSAVVGSCNILALQFGLSLPPPANGGGQILVPGPGVCLGSVLNLMQVIGQDPECANCVLKALADDLMQQPRWQPFVNLVDRGKPFGFLGAIAARGGPEVPWAPTEQKDSEDVDMTTVIMDFYMRIVRSGCVPPPAPRRVVPVPDKEDFERWIMAYVACNSDGLVGAEDAMLLIQAVTGERCDEFTYTHFCKQISRHPGVGITVGDAKALLKELRPEQLQKLYHDLELGPGKFGEGYIHRAHKNRQLLEKKVTAAATSAWSLTDTLGLWLTHFFGPPAAQTGLVLPDESAGGAGSGRCCSCCRSGTVKKKGHASEIRGLLALQARPEELARSWRGAVERGVASLPARVRAPKSRMALASLLGAGKRSAGKRSAAQRSQRITPYNARAQLLADDADPASSGPDGSICNFHNDLCHSRTEMSRGGLRRDEKGNLATLRRKSTRILSLYAHRIDLYTVPALVYVAVVAIYEAALLLVLPQLLLAHETGERLGDDVARASLVASALVSLLLGQACGSWRQGQRVRPVNACPLPAKMRFVMVAINGWETDSLAVSVLTFLGGQLQTWAWLREDMPVAVMIAKLVTAAFLLGVCRPLAETALILRPRCGHFDGYQRIPSLNAAFLCRTAAAALGLPFLLWYSGWEDDVVVEVELRVDALWAPTPAKQHFGNTGATIVRLANCLSWVAVLALTPWLVSALNKWPYMHPVRRALHYSPPPRIVGSGGPPISGHPVVGYVAMSSLVMKWQAPHSTRNLVYDAQVSVDYGIWEPAKRLDIIWPRDRHEPSCRVDIKSIEKGESVRFRVRCAPVDSLDNYHNAELGKEALIWGPWSTPSQLIQRPGELRYVRPLMFLILLPVSLLHTLFYSLPTAWLGKVAEKHQDCSLHIFRYLLLVMIWPMVCIHLFCWEFPLWAKQQLRKGGLCLVLVLPLAIVILPHMFLDMVHRLKVRFRKSRDIEELPLIIEYGPLLELTVAKRSVQDIVGSSSQDVREDEVQIRLLQAAGFDDDFQPTLYQHASRIKLACACTRVTLSICTRGRDKIDNIYIESVLRMCGKTDALDSCAGAWIIERPVDLVSLPSRSVHRSHPTNSPSGNWFASPESNSGGWFSSRRLPLEQCLLLVPPPEVPADAQTLAELTSQAAAQGAVGIILVLDTCSTSAREPPPDLHAPSLRLPLFCITNESAVKLQDQLSRYGQHVMDKSIRRSLQSKDSSNVSGVVLGGIALHAEGQEVEAVNASWTSNASWDPKRQIHEQIALQYRPAIDEEKSEDQWTTCAVATARSRSILVVLPFGSEAHDQFRLLGHARGSWQPLSLITYVAKLELPDTVDYTKSLGGTNAAARTESAHLYETQVPIEIENGLSKLSTVVDRLAKKQTRERGAVFQPSRATTKRSSSVAAMGPVTPEKPKAAGRREQLDSAHRRIVQKEHEASKSQVHGEVGGVTTAVSHGAASVSAVRGRNYQQQEREDPRVNIFSAGEASREPTDPGCDFGASASVASGHSRTHNQHSAAAAPMGSPFVGSSTWLAAGVAASRAARPQRYNNIDWLG